MRKNWEVGDTVTLFHKSDRLGEGVITSIAMEIRFGDNPENLLKFDPFTGIEIGDERYVRRTNEEKAEDKKG